MTTEKKRAKENELARIVVEVTVAVSRLFEVADCPKDNFPEEIDKQLSWLSDQGVFAPETKDLAQKFSDLADLEAHAKKRRVLSLQQFEIIIDCGVSLVQDINRHVTAFVD